MSFKGKFVWYELMTTDMKAAEKFYGGVTGWTAKDAGMPGMSYSLLSAGETMVAGLMATPPGVKPAWVGYIAVDDVDAEAAAIEKEGGVVHKPPADIPNVGRFAIVGDPQGTAYAIFKGTSEAPPPQPPRGTPGLIGWHELHAVKWEPAWDFYAKHYGWTKDQGFDMGPMGTYQLFSSDGQQLGGMMTKTKDMPMAAWLYYVNVDAADAAAERVKKGGGQVLMGPQDVPGGQWIVQGLDPQGAMFCLLASKR